MSTGATSRSNIFYKIIANNDHVTHKQLKHFYNTGEQVMLRVPKQFRLKIHAVEIGPVIVRAVDDNDYITIDKGKATEHVIMCRIFHANF